jgi:hypothetical protein
MKKTTTPPSKTCTRCSIPKPLSAFNKAPENPDGRRAMCKTCDREVRKEKKAREEEYGNEFFKF